MEQILGSELGSARSVWPHQLGLLEVCFDPLPSHTTFSASGPCSMASGHPEAHFSVPSDPCHNGGSCTDGINTAFCDCLPGFQGAFCEEDINECASNPCRNGANCTDCVDSYTCTCPAGFNGIHCENNTPDCTERCVSDSPWSVWHVDQELCYLHKGPGGTWHWLRQGKKWMVEHTKWMTACHLKQVSCPDPVGI